MTYMGGRISEKDAADPAAAAPQGASAQPDGAPPRFLVNIINKRELTLLEELLGQNNVPYAVRNASKKNRRPNAAGFSMLGKDIYVDNDHYDRARAALADYYLGGEQATADTNTVPAARRQQAPAVRGKRYPIKKLVLWLALATVGYTLLFTLWMHMMN